MAEKDYKVIGIEEITNLIEDIEVKIKKKGSIIVGDRIVPCDVIPTGSIVIDEALGVGGIPRGRIIEIFGPESSGKTTLALNVAKNAQRQGGLVAFIDAEHALDAKYAKQIGLDVNKLMISQPDSGEQALQIAELLTESGKVDLIVVDSVAALVPEAELEGNVGDHHVGAQARMMSQALRKIKGKLNKSNTAIIFINQLREKIGVMFGSPETTSGGRALKFYSSIRIDIRRVSSIKSSDQSVGNNVKIKVVKNKVAPPFRVAHFEIYFGKGINRAGGALSKGVEHNIIEKKGNFYKIGEIQLGNGKNNAIEYLESHPDLLESIEADVYIKLGLQPPKYIVDIPKDEESCQEPHFTEEEK